jgi:hypothetical protein
MRIALTELLKLQKLLLFIIKHIRWVTRQIKLEIPNDEEEVNTREIHKCDGQSHDSDTMVDPPTPNPSVFYVVYYKSRKRELNPKLMNESV